MKLVKFKAAKMVEQKDDVLRNIDPNYLFVDVVDADIHEDITSIEAIYVFGMLTPRDYITYVSEIVAAADSKGEFGDLTPTEQKIYAKLGLSSKAQAASVGITSFDYSKAIRDLSAKTMDARKERIETLRLDLSEEFGDGILTKEHSNLILLDTVTMVKAWERGKHPEFIEWITDSGEHVSTGLSSKVYYTPERKQKFVDRIINGVPYP
jgi:hypothetical protein